MGRSRIALLVLAACSTLAGCEKLEAYKSAPEDIAALKAQVATLQKQSNDQQGELLILRIQSRIDKQDAESAAQRAKQPQRLPAEQIASLKVTIAGCVKQVRSQASESDSRLFPPFDAFYNEASGRVQDNVQYNGQMPSKFAFDKCMAVNGWPLT